MWQTKEEVLVLWATFVAPYVIKLFSCVTVVFLQSMKAHIGLI